LGSAGLIPDGTNEIAIVLIKFALLWNLQEKIAPPVLTGGAVVTDYLLMFGCVGFLTLSAKSTRAVGCV
jgi:hypothetical protein